MIVEKQEGNKRAKYGDFLIKKISKKLIENLGKGFSSRNLKRMRKLYMYYPKGTTMLSQLSWSHYLELMKISDKKKRDFYMRECISSNWDVRELQRQRTTLLYTLPEDNKTIFSSEFKLTIPSEKELISIIENKKRNNINLM